MESSFEVKGKLFKVDLSFYGYEKYFYDGNLLLKRWSFKFKDRLSFMCDGSNVEIDVSLTHRDWSIRAFIDGVLAVEELFPDYKERLDQARKNTRITKAGVLKNVVLWCVLVVVLYSIFEWME